MPDGEPRSIKPTDILALRFECKNCGSALTMSPERYSKWEEENRPQQGKPKPALADCPVCGEKWGTYQPRVSEFVIALRNLTAMLEEKEKKETKEQNEEEKKPTGLSLTLQVKGEGPPPANQPSQ